MVITFKNPEDLQQFVGWRIEAIALGTQNGDVLMTLRLGHLAADDEVELTILAQPSFGRSGNIQISNGELKFHVALKGKVPDTNRK